MSADDHAIVLVAGPVKIADRVGHHDYLAGCRLAAALLEQTPHVRATTIRDGWPEDDRTFEAASAIVFYTGAMEKENHAGLESAERVARMQRLIDAGVGIVMLHQAVRCSLELAPRAMTWLGGVHTRGKRGRGHWATRHDRFPAHPVTSGVEPWTATDGWLNEIHFVDGMRGVTPLLWSSRSHGGSERGGMPAVVAWAYERPDRGRSFCFTGLDAHDAWSIPGVRRLLVNGILWAAGASVPEDGALCAVDAIDLDGYLTPRPKGGFFSGWRRRFAGRGSR